MDKWNYIWIGILVFTIIIAIAFIIFYFYVLNEYKDVPVNEMPIWVWWLLGQRNR